MEKPRWLKRAERAAVVLALMTFAGGVLMALGGGSYRFGERAFYAVLSAGLMFGVVTGIAHSVYWVWSAD